MFVLSPLEIRKLAYQCANEFGIECPTTWNENQHEGKNDFFDLGKDIPHYPFTILNQVVLL